MGCSEDSFDLIHGEDFWNKFFSKESDREEGVEECYVSDENSDKIKTYSMFKNRFEREQGRCCIPWENHGEIIFDELQQENEIHMGRFLWPVTVNKYAEVAI